MNKLAYFALLGSASAENWMSRWSTEAQCDFGFGCTAEHNRVNTNKDTDCVRENENQSLCNWHGWPYLFNKCDIKESPTISRLSTYTEVTSWCNEKIYGDLPKQLTSCIVSNKSLCKWDTWS